MLTNKDVKNLGKQRKSTATWSALWDLTCFVGLTLGSALLMAWTLFHWVTGG